MKHVLTLASVSLLLLSGCNHETIQQTQSTDGLLTIHFTSTGMTNGTATDTESQINTLNAYRFENGILKETFNTLQVNENSTCQLNTEQKQGNLYFLANATEIVSQANLINNVTTLDEFLKLTATSKEMTSENLLMTGSSPLEHNNTSLSVALKRAVARIDLESPFVDTEVNSLVIKEIALTGWIHEQDASRSPEKFETISLTKEFGEQPFKNGRMVLCYLPEQHSTSHEVEIRMTANGGWHRLRTTLPPLKRNTIYTLKVYGNGSNLKVEVLTDDWESGTSSESDLTYKGLVDKENSQFSKGVTLNEYGDTIFVPHWESNFQVALVAEAGAAVTIQGNAPGVTVTPAKHFRSLSPIAEVHVYSNRKMPGSQREYVYLDIHKEQIHTGRIVLVFTPNPLQMKGLLYFDENGECNFNRYVDGELARLSLPEGKNITLKFNHEEAEWMKLTEEGNNTFRLLGGWKPNDPKADGREQEGQLIVSDADGSYSETYIIRRQNWGLPVVNINGVWWCKYNLRGNVKSFNDQILIPTDPVQESNLADFMETCSDEEFLNILGDQYQAGNPDGLQLSHNGYSFYYEGYQTQTDNFGTMPPTSMAPDGYQLPDFDNYRFFTGSTDFNLHYYNPGAFNNGLGQRLNFKVVERNANFNGHTYGPVTFYDFEYEGNHWTLCGLGHQYNETSISPMTILLATHGNSNNTWMMEGYAQSNGQGNWFKYAASNAQKTRTIRCIKTPVEYIYE